MGCNSQISWEPMPSEESLQARNPYGCGVDFDFGIADSDSPLGTRFDGLTPLEHQLFDPFISFFPPVMLVIFVAQNLPIWFKTGLTFLSWLVG